ncbi:TdcF protein [[Emmonsia] crescens]|uniref:TdcF protein n=2 Tax=[Emmonsia] crescens TaxID=73230 RepID=A0A2B7ZQ95_9EURO|nr:endoribonuclease L-PSP [Emmonsia crescens UAMH 3008]PGH35358.1 TdcF protein [Emmonsia crescens]
MASKKVILTDKAPKPRPVLSQAIVHNDMIYCSGSLGMDPVTEKMVEGTVEARTEQSLRNLAAVLEAGGSSLDNVVKVNVFLASMDDFAAMNKVYARFFSGPAKPCRTCVAVKQLPRDTDVEIECTAFL